MRLYLLECKKIMTSRFHLILLLLFMMLPMVIFQNRITDTGENTNPYRHADGRDVYKRQVAELKDKSGEERIAALNEIGILYAEAKQTDEAITYLEMSLSEKKDLGKGYRALLNLYNTKRREAAKAKDDEQIQYYLRKIDEMMAISKEVTRASF